MFSISYFKWDSSYQDSDGNNFLQNLSRFAETIFDILSTVDNFKDSDVSFAIDADASQRCVTVNRFGWIPSHRRYDLIKSEKEKTW